MTLRQIIRRLEDAGIENPSGDARALATRFSGLTDVALRSSPDEELPDPDGALSRAVAAREARQPLQYLLGTWGFWRQEYEVTPDCLIPRADTERLVELAAELLPPHAQFLDLCTGSGCVAVSTLCERPDTTAVAVDLFPATLEVARRNAAHCGVGEDRLTFLPADVLADGYLDGLGRFDAILSNPPYIPTGDLAGLAPELSFEPRAALDGGEDGLLFYRHFLTSPACRAALTESGFFGFEIGYDQGDALRALAAREGWHCRILKDLGGRDRVAIVTPAVSGE